MKSLFCQKISLVLVAILTASSLAIAADVDYGCDIMIQNEDGRFSGRMSSRYVATGLGLVSSFSLSFEWTALLGEPLEYYLFKWERGHTVSLGGNHLARGELLEYPDLLRRFDNLKPRNVELSMGIAFGSSAQTLSMPELQVAGECQQGYQVTYGCRSRFSKLVKETPNLMIEEAGVVGDNITPTSPVEGWVDFFNRDGFRDLLDDEGVDAVNKKLYGMMRAADEIRVHNLTLSSYEINEVEFESIHEALIKRRDEERKEDELERAKEREERSSADNEDSLTDGGDSGNDSTASSDDFWNGEENSNSVESDFWNGEEVNKEEAASFWNDPAEFRKACNDSYYTTWDSGSSDCVELTLDTEESADFGEQYAAGGAGVHIFDFPQKPSQGQRLNLQYEMFTALDRAVVIFIADGRENTVLDTGMIGGNGTRTIPAFYGDAVRLIMTGSTDGTQWNFTLSD